MTRYVARRDRSGAWGVLDTELMLFAGFTITAKHQMAKDAAEELNAGRIARRMYFWRPATECLDEEPTP